MVENPPPAILRRLSGFKRTEWSVPVNTAEVSRWEAPDGHRIVLKVGRQLQAECERLHWLDGRLPVPKVVAFVRGPSVDFLLMTELTGRPALDPAVLAQPDDLVDELARILRVVHSVSAGSCPFHAGTERLLEIAGERVLGGRLERGPFASRYPFREPVEMLAEMARSQPPEDERVFTHGDPSIVNFLFVDGTVSGILDVGLAGIGDRYRDLAIMARSIARNLGRGYLSRFFSAYGAPFDRPRLEFFALLDEFVMTRPA